MESTVHGIILLDDGSFFMAIMEKNASGWRLRKTRAWPSTHLLINASLLSRSVLCGLSAHWHPSTDGDQTRSEILYPHANEATALACEQLLAANCAGMVPDDAFLCTLPLAFSTTHAGSFISVCKETSFYKIGVTINESLCGVFNLAPARSEMLESHLGRISRFIQRAAPDCVFPTQVFCLGFSAPEMPPYTVTSLETVPGDNQTLRTAGVALAKAIGRVPLLRPATRRHGVRRIRAVMYCAAAACLLLTLLACTALPLARFFLTRQRDACKARYETLLNANADIRETAVANGELAHKIIAGNAVALKQTRWSRLLQYLGDARPAGVWFEMLGSEPLNVQSGFSGIALSGWGDNESHITALISLLQKSGLAVDVSLASLERDTEKNVFLFRILCTAKLYGLPITK
jgi:Tfp pilus assembly protein PilN